MIFSSYLKNLAHCIAHIWLWLTKHFLRLNDNKINIYLVLPLCVKSLRTPGLHMGASSITPNGPGKKYLCYISYRLLQIPVIEDNGLVLKRLGITELHVVADNCCIEKLYISYLPAIF